MTHDQPEEAAKLQKLYRANKKKAMDQVLVGYSRFCRVCQAEVEKHYRGVFSPDDYTVGSPQGGPWRHA